MICQDPIIALAYTAQNTRKGALLACLAQRPPARLYCGGQLLQATLPGPCRACLVSHLWQLVPYAALGLERDGANNLASSRLESWALDDSSVEWKFNLLDKKEETIAKRFKIVLAEKPNVQEAAERSRNRKYFSCCCCCCCSHTNSHNQVRGHRTGSSHSGAEEYLGKNTKNLRW